MAEFPEILHCLICEDLRPELNRKTTITGFYGVAPQVTILLREFANPIERLVFLLITGPTKGPAEFNAGVKLLGPDGGELVAIPKYPIPVSRDAQVLQFAIGFGNLGFKSPGSHTLLLTIDDVERFRTTFEIQQGKKGDFAGD